MKRIVFKHVCVLLLYLSASSRVISQDSAVVDEPDSIFFEDKRNYLGINVSPLITNAFGGENKSAKVCFTYKRNRGDKNFRFSVNYLTLANRTPYYTFKTIGSSDTSITNRYFESDYKSYDFRIGFEELKGSGLSRFHIGVDLILGYASFYSEYRDSKLYVDSLGRYLIPKEASPIYTGSHASNYYHTGLDVSFGFDWFLDDVFMITLQLTPQFNYYIANEEKLIDQYKEYSPIDNFVDFHLGYFDIMLLYKF